MAPGKQGFTTWATARGIPCVRWSKPASRVAGRPIKTTGKPPVPAIHAARCFGGEGGERAGWKPEFPTLEAIVTSAWRWHKHHPHGYFGLRCVRISSLSL